MATMINYARGTTSKDNLGPAILEAMWILMVFASIVLGMRFYVRFRMIKKVSVDDWVMLFSYAQTVVSTICFTVAVHYGLGRHQETLGPEDAVQASKWNLVGQVTGILSGTFARVSFCMMLFAITSAQQRIQRSILWTIGVSQILLNVALSIFILTQCQPITKLWDKSVAGKCLGPENQQHFGFVQGSINSVTDLALAIFPATIIWSLNMKLAVKLSLIIMMGLGIFTMAASIVKTVYLKSLAKVTDYSYETSYLIVWFTLEIWFLIIAACIPTLRPLLARAQQTITGSQSRGTKLSNGSNRWTQRRNFSNLDSDNAKLTNSSIGTPYELSHCSAGSESMGKAIHMEPNNERHGGITKTVDVEIRY